MSSHNRTPCNIWEGCPPRVLIGEGVPRAITDEGYTFTNVALNGKERPPIRVRNRASISSYIFVWVPL
jgi:hypothetical protein